MWGERGKFLWIAQKHTGNISCILSMAFAKSLYAIPLSTHGAIGKGGGKEKYPLNTSQKKSSFLSTSDEYFTSPYEQYPVTICGQTIILTNGELAAALLSLPEKKREIIYLYFFGNYTQQEIADLYGQCKSTAWHYIHSALQMLQEEMEVLLRGES